MSCPCRLGYGGDGIEERLRLTRLSAIGEQKVLFHRTGRTPRGAERLEESRIVKPAGWLIDVRWRKWRRRISGEILAHLVCRAAY